MKYSPSIFLSILLLLLTGCQEGKPACSVVTGTPQYLTVPPEVLATPIPGPSPIQYVIDGKTMQVDKVVEGPLCNDTWSGTVYVTCNVQVYP